MEGAIPAKDKAFGEAGGVGPTDTRSKKQNPNGVRGLAELYPRFRDPGTQAPAAPGPAAGQRPTAKSAVLTAAEAPAQKFAAPAREIAALLSIQATEEAEVFTGKELAARFVRREREDEVSAPASRPLTPYLAAGALILLAGAGAAYYYSRQEGSGTAVAGNAYVGANFATSEAHRQPETAQGSASNSWAETVETFRKLAGPEASTQEKVAEPQPGADG
ncbi:MAG: hypothetical protein ACLPX9_12445, partial [Rhodomicrobium sp.]